MEESVSREVRFDFLIAMLYAQGGICRVIERIPLGLSIVTEEDGEVRYEQQPVMFLVEGIWVMLPR